jgi:hypothetical protein
MCGRYLITRRTVAPSIHKKLSSERAAESRAGTVKRGKNAGSIKA